MMMCRCQVKAVLVAIRIQVRRFCGLVALSLLSLALLASLAAFAALTFRLLLLEALGVAVRRIAVVIGLFI